MQTMTMSETVLGLRYGPVTALDKQTLFICFVSGDKRRAHYARDLLQEVSEKDVIVECIAVGPKAAKKEFPVSCDFYLPINAYVDDAYRPVIDVIFGQLLGLYCFITLPASEFTKRGLSDQSRCSENSHLVET